MKLKIAIFILSYSTFSYSYSPCICLSLGFANQELAMLFIEYVHKRVRLRAMPIPMLYS